MWIYEKKMQYPVNIKNANPRLAKVIISQLGGPDGELGASLRYMCQRYAMPQAKVKGLLTDISTEELACARYQLYNQIKAAAGKCSHYAAAFSYCLTKSFLYNLGKSNPLSISGIPIYYRYR